MQRTEIDQHRARCPFELLTCPNLMPLCEPYLRKDKEIHEKNCRSYPCHYGLSGCPFVGTLVEVNAHCEIYCGKLHQRLKELEDECARLKKIVSNYENGNEMQASKQQSASALDDMDLLQQVLNNDDYLNLLNATTPDSKSIDHHPMPATAPISLQPTPNNMTDLMDLTDCLAPAPMNTSGTTPSLTTIPKRAPNGKIIRYSKNARLAQSARRMARQQQAHQELSPFDALLEELDIRSPSSMHALSPPPLSGAPLSNNSSNNNRLSSQANNPFSFKNLDDVSKFLADFPEPVPSEDDTRSKESTSRYPSSPSSKQPSSQQRKAGTERKKASMSTSVRSPKASSAPSPSNHTSPSPAGSAAPKRNMFVLASSYLTNYGNNNTSSSSSSNSNNRSNSNNA